LKSLSILSNIIPLLSFIFFYKKNKRKEVFILFIYVIISFATDFILSSLNKKLHPSSLFTVLSLFTILEYFFFTLFIYLVIKRAIFRRLFAALSIIFIIFSLIHYWLNVGKQNFDSLPASVESILIVFFCILYLFEQINTPEVVLVYESYKFWIIIGFLIYLAGGLSLYILAANLTDEEMNSYWKINYAFNMVKNLLFAIAFAMKKENLNTHSLYKSYNI
jgi:hypothetical protein